MTSTVPSAPGIPVPHRSESARAGTPRRDPAGTKQRILLAAIDAFRCGGLAGARVDDIARRAQTNERMLYYYFGSKEQLFVAVIEKVYEAFARQQAVLDIQRDPPEEAMKKFIRFVWDYCYSHPEVVRLINNENLQEGVHLKTSATRDAMRPVIDVVLRLLQRGEKAGVFRAGVEPLHCYLAISGLGYYLVSNRYTLRAAFGRDPADLDEREPLLALHTDMLLAYLRAPPTPPSHVAPHVPLPAPPHAPPQAPR